MATFSKSVAPASVGASPGRRVRLATAIVLAAIVLSISGLVIGWQVFQRSAVPGAAEGGQQIKLSDSYPDAGLRNRVIAPAFESYPDAGLRNRVIAPAFESYPDAGLRHGSGARSATAADGSGFGCLLRQKIDDC